MNGRNAAKSALCERRPDAGRELPVSGFFCACRGKIIRKQLTNGKKENIINI